MIPSTINCVWLADWLCWILLGWTTDSQGVKKNDVKKQLAWQEHKDLSIITLLLMFEVIVKASVESLFFRLHFLPKHQTLFSTPHTISINKSWQACFLACCFQGVVTKAKVFAQYHSVCFFWHFYFPLLFTQHTALKKISASKKIELSPPSSK